MDPCCLDSRSAPSPKAERRKENHYRIVREKQQDVLDQVNHILSFHTISSNTDEPDGRIRFVLDEYGDVDVDGKFE